MRNINRLCNMFFKLKGTLNFIPEEKTKKHIAHAEWKKVALIETGCDFDRYYAWFLKKRFNLELVKNLRGSHVTIISDVVDVDRFEEVANRLQGKPIVFYIENEPRSNGKHWWLRVYSPVAEDIRQSIGLKREPYFSFHLTIGYINEKQLEHSHYIVEQCKKFHITSSEPRKHWLEVKKSLSHQLWRMSKLF